MTKSKNYKFEKIGDNVFIATSKNHTFGTDAILLANFAAQARFLTSLDIGCGCGIIPMSLMNISSPHEVWGADIDEQAVNQFTASKEASTLSCEVHPVCCDIRDFGDKLKVGYFDTITCNPPYNAMGTGIISENDKKAAARHDVSCTTTDLASAAYKLLKSKGKLFICQQPHRLTDIICEMRAYKLEPKRLRLVSYSEEKAPFMFLLELRKDGGSHMTIEPQLNIKKDGKYSAEYKEIYGGYYTCQE